MRREGVFISNEMAIKVIAGLIIFLVVLNFIIDEHIETTVDEDNRRLLITKRNRFSTKKFIVPMQMIRSIYIRRIGKGITAKYVVRISLKNKKKYNLANFFNSYAEALTYAGHIKSFTGEETELHENTLAFFFNWF